METRKTTLKADPRGDFRPYIGFRKDGKQQRFNLGDELAEAERRRDRIQRLYSESVAARRSYGQSPSWTEAALHAAKLIERGFHQIPLPEPAVVNEACGDGLEIGNFDPCWNPLAPEALMWSHAVASRHYPSINWMLPDGNPGQAAIRFGQQLFNIQARRQARLLGAATPANPVAGTFHEALDKYDQFIETDVSLRVTPGTKANRHGQVKQLKIEHEDMPLAFMDLAACKKLFDHWTARPIMDKETGERYGNGTCKHRISELSMFFDWLHGTPEFLWRKPADYDTISKVIVKDKTKRSIRELISKPPFSVEELATINRHCDPLERLLLYLGLNCAFGAAESGRLEFDDVYFRQKNPLAHVWKNQKFTSDDSDSWIAYLRPKTGVAGCWWLFPETVEALEIWMKERPKANTERIIVTEAGTSLYRDESKNAQSGFNNLWTRLLKRIDRAQAKSSGDEEKRIVRLPFGALRDQLPDWAVHEGDSESSSIALAHGKPFKDDLLGCYANLPFPRLFEVQKRYREFLMPVFEAAASPRCSTDDGTE